MAQARNWYEPGIKNDFEEMEHEFAFGIFRPEKQDCPFQMFRSSRDSFAGTTQQAVCSIHFPTGFSGNFLIVNNRGLADTPV